LVAGGRTSLAKRLLLVSAETLQLADDAFAYRSSIRATKRRPRLASRRDRLATQRHSAWARCSGGPGRYRAWRQLTDRSRSIHGAPRSVDAVGESSRPGRTLPMGSQ